MHETLSPLDCKGMEFLHYADLPDASVVGIRQVDTMVAEIPLYGLKGQVKLYRLDVLREEGEDCKWLLVFQPRSAHASQAVVYTTIDTQQNLPDHQATRKLFKKLPPSSMDLALCFSPQWRSEATKVQLVEMFYPQLADSLEGQHGGSATLHEVTFTHDEGERSLWVQVGAFLKRLADAEDDAPPEPRWVPRPA